MALSRIDTTNMIEDVPQSKLDNNINFRNILINSDMSIAQRGTSASSLSSGNSYHSIDRYKTQIVNTGTWTQSQSTTVPSGQGFGYSLKMDCTTADASLGADDFLVVRQDVEAQNLQYLKYGTSNAESITMSFWVRSNKTGIYNIWLFAEDNSKSISAPYTISSANTWEKKTITFTGDTASSITNDNGTGIRVYFILSAGSNWTSGTTPTTWEADTKANRAVGQVNLADSTANEWYITGVQLEAGQTASEFEFLPVDVNLGRCQRYHQTSIPIGSFFSSTTGVGAHHVMSWSDGNVTGKVFPTPMRATPTITLRQDTSTTTGIIKTSAGDKSASASAVNSTSIGFLNVTSGAATNYALYHYRADAEL